MKTINYEELEFIDKNNEYSSGSFGKIKRCYFDGILYAYKSFNSDKYLVGKKKKIDELSEINNPFLLTPCFWVKKDGKTNQYLAPYCTGKNIDLICDDPIEEKKEILLKTKSGIISMHESKIIHGDLIGSNIMVENSLPYFIDFDNCGYKSYKISPTQTNDHSQTFISGYGIKKELDIFIFNLLTFSLINNIDFQHCRQNIYKGNFGYFNNSEARKICNSFSLENKIPCSDFLIDTLEIKDQTGFKI